MVVSTAMVGSPLPHLRRMFRIWEYRHKIQIELVEDDHAYRANQFAMYDQNGEEITDLYNS